MQLLCHSRLLLLLLLLLATLSAPVIPTTSSDQ